MNMPAPILTFDFYGTCKVFPSLAHYDNDRLAIQLLDAVDGDSWGVLTVNVPQAILQSDEVICKNYSENEAVYKAAVEAGWLVPTGRLIPSGFVELPVCRVAGDLIAFVGTEHPLA